MREGIYTCVYTWRCPGPAERPKSCLENGLLGYEKRERERQRERRCHNCPRARSRIRSRAQQHGFARMHACTQRTYARTREGSLLDSRKMRVRSICKSSARERRQFPGESRRSLRAMLLFRAIMIISPERRLPTSAVGDFDRTGHSRPSVSSAGDRVRTKRERHYDPLIRRCRSRPREAPFARSSDDFHTYTISGHYRFL